MSQGSGDRNNDELLSDTPTLGDECLVGVGGQQPAVLSASSPGMESASKTEGRVLRAPGFPMHDTQSRTSLPQVSVRHKKEALTS